MRPGNSIIPWLRRLGLAGVLWALPALAESGFVVDNDGKRYEGDIQADGGGTLKVTSDADKESAIGPRRFAFGRYRYAMVRKPPEVSGLEAALAAKKFDEIRSQAGALYRKYHYLGWADLVSYCEGTALLQTGDSKGAEEAFERGLKAPGEQGDNYARCRLGRVLLWQKLGRREEMHKELASLVQSPAPSVAVDALMLRAKEFEQQGDKRAAIADYLKIVLFFKEGTGASAMPERAAAKQAAIRLLQELKDSKHGKTVETL
jgi:tetratricopeptide (TPR) repeat protein